MAQSTATGLIMPAVPEGQTKRPPVPAGSPNYIPTRASTGGYVQSLQPLGDGTPVNADLEEEDTYASVEVGVVAIPHFPREWRRYLSAHGATGIPIKELHTYTQQAAQYVSVVVPSLLGDDATGLPEEEGMDEVISVSASDAMRFGGNVRGSAIPSEATKAYLAHQANQIMSDGEVSPTGATGVWSIAGRV